MNKNEKVRVGIWVRCLAIGIALPIICVWGSPVAGLVILAFGIILGAMLDAVDAQKQAEENKKKSDENYAKLMEKINKYK